ncbi:SMC-Scp complex subunit ScpB [Rothia uropygioeca]|uniref:SMC-Scp complex subunit ScpB n=1 Tax=Kocuria sp. 257 TaxID=2021970 RepID=UPI001010828B|nr:SMC-Scp complex subunit ScpB [Kocuria sp. 257]
MSELTDHDPATPPTDAPEPGRVDLMPGGIKAAVEAILMVAESSVNEFELAEALLVPVKSVERALDELARDYDGYTDTFVADVAGSSDDQADEQAPSTGSLRPREPRGMELRRVGGGWRLYARTEFAPWVSRFILEGQTSKLSQAALETLAVIAYRQPVSRARVSSIRGVNVDGVVRTLKTRGLVTEDEERGESGSILYVTTPMFLEKIGLESLEDLPKISPYLPDVEDIGEYEQRLKGR